VPKERGGVGEVAGRVSIEEPGLNNGGEIYQT
jgi:hypothetical protein